jgi:hypothetical protein
MNCMNKRIGTYDESYSSLSLPPSTSYASEKLTGNDISRIIEMAWEDRTTFDAIRVQFGLIRYGVNGLKLEKPNMLNCD